MPLWDNRGGYGFGMIITYELLLDGSYYRTVVERYYKQRPWLLKLPVIFSLSWIPFIVLWAYCYGTNAQWMKLSPWDILYCFIVSVIGIVVLKWMIARRFKKRADYNTEVKISMSDDGISAGGLHVKGEWDWAAYPRAVRFPDGILLLRKGVIRWLPDSAIQKGTPEDATALVQSKAELRHI